MMKGRGRFKKDTVEQLGEINLNQPEAAPCNEQFAFGCSDFALETNAFNDENAYSNQPKSYENGNSNGYNRSGGDRNCFKCNQPGHMSRDCPEAGSSNNSRNCYKCNQPGHTSRDCPEAGNSGGGGGDRTCYKCKQSGHMSRDCPEAANSGGGDRNCFKCNQPGHMSRDCPEAGSSNNSRNCYKCNQPGHTSRDCPEAGNSGGDRTCYKCKQSGHMSRDCPEAGNSGGGGDRNCYKCNQPGHMSRDCPEAGNSGGGGGDRNCFKCHQPGHMSRECPEAGNGEENGETKEGIKPAVFCPPELNKESALEYMNTGIAFDQYDDVGIKIIGDNQPKTMTTFSEMGLPEELTRALQKLNYKSPTPIQKAVIPCVLSNRDIIGIAQTGSGKTAAFLLPILTLLLKSGNYKELDNDDAPSSSARPRALILTPTRELAEQIFRHSSMLADFTGISSSFAYGGIQVVHNRRVLMSGCDILAATLGRLDDFLQKGFISLEKCDYLILDEADRMLEQNGFYEGIQNIVEKFRGKKPQVLMFSATFDKDVSELAKEFLDPSPLRIEIGIVGGANVDVTQKVFLVPSPKKEKKLEEILENLKDKKVLIFAEKKTQVDFLGLMYATSFADNTHVMTIHSDRTQEQRYQTIAEFSRRRTAILFATSVAARGLDIPSVDVVINYDMPKAIAEYVHRIGRTARAGRKGESITFFDMRNDGSLAESLIETLASAQQTVPQWLQELSDGGGGGGGFDGGNGNDNNADSTNFGVEDDLNNFEFAGFANI